MDADPRDILNEMPTKEELQYAAVHASAAGGETPHDSRGTRRVKVAWITGSVDTRGVVHFVARAQR